MLEIEINPAVRITAPELVRLRTQTINLRLWSSRIKARQGGDYLSSFKGRGMEFDESRPYEPGDDIRNLDWRVMARTGKPHTKLFREERERPVFFGVDYRAPMFFATRGVYKAVMAAHLTSILAWSASDHSDRVGAVIFSEHAHRELKPQRGKKGVLSLIRSLVEHPAWEKSAGYNNGAETLKQSLARLQRVVRPGSLIFLLSDFRQFDAAARVQLRQLQRHNEIILIFISDPLERELPHAGRYRLSDGQEEYLLDTGNQEYVHEYRHRFMQHKAMLDGLAHQSGCRLIEALTTDDPVKVINNVC